MDYSTVGYRMGNMSLPEVIPDTQIEATRDGDGSDDTLRIQEAIDAVSALPLGSNGIRGNVRLGRGIFLCNRSLRISTRSRDTLHYSLLSSI